MNLGYPDAAFSVPGKLVLIVVGLTAVLGLPSGAQASSCESLTQFSSPGTVINSATSVPEGSLTVAPGQTLSGLPPFCRVSGVIRPSTDSNINFELWLPSTGWNGRYAQVGNGGLAGSIQYAWMSPVLQRGDAVAGTDDGHQAGGLDGSWALGHPEKILDFGYRAVHLTSVVSKELVTAFYGRSASYFYFDACSEGGREALIEAQRFPGDFDGILLGSPANYWTDLMVRFLWDQRALLDTAASYIPPAKLPAVQAASLAACNAEEGTSGSYVTDPRRCRWDPETLLCPSGVDDDTCLTQPQVDSLLAIYNGPVNPITGQRITRGYERTGENSGNWNSYIIGTQPGNALQFLFSTSYYKNFVFNDLNWDYHTFDFDRDVTFARQQMAGTLDAANPDLHPFEQHGGKMIQYHGWIDASPHPRGSIKYYRSVIANRPLGIGGLSQTQAFYRLFMVPGMEHCIGGPGPNAFGQQGAPVPPSSDARHDILTALEHWVERGQAPAEVIATKYVDDDPASGIQAQRPLCPYPEEARWRGYGSITEAGSYVCARAGNDR